MSAVACLSPYVYDEPGLSRSTPKVKVPADAEGYKTRSRSWLVCERALATRTPGYGTSFKIGPASVVFDGPYIKVIQHIEV
jgi:hypothetical protein